MCDHAARYLAGKGDEIMLVNDVSLNNSLDVTAGVNESDARVVKVDLLRNIGVMGADGASTE